MSEHNFLFQFMKVNEFRQFTEFKGLKLKKSQFLSRANLAKGSFHVESDDSFPYLVLGFYQLSIIYQKLKAPIMLAIS